MTWIIQHDEEQLLFTLTPANMETHWDTVTTVSETRSQSSAEAGNYSINLPVNYSQLRVSSLVTDSVRGAG